MQAAEQPADNATQGSKAATKRARKKAARQQAAAAASGAQVANTAAQAAAAPSGPAHQAAVGSGSSSTAGAGALHPEGAPVLQAAVISDGTSSGAEEVPLHQAATASRPAAQSEWWRCPLSSEVMRDPVLYGSGGHSYERTALEGWLAANPGVDPTSQLPLPPGGGSVLPNHTLRNMIQQLQLD